MRKLITSRHKQRGNIVFTTGLPPTAIEPVAGDAGPGWSLIEEWDVGDLPFIESAGGYNGDTCGDTLAWSIDGTRLTLSSGANTNDNIKTFLCTTPFDPSTAVSLLSTQNVLNSQGGRYDVSGTKFFTLHTVGDEISHFGATNFTVHNQAGELSDIDKSELGFTASSDGSFTINAAGTILFWRGQNGGQRWVTGNIPGGDLDSFTQIVSVASPDSTSTQGLSPINADENLIIKCNGSPGVSFYTFDDLQTLGNAAEGANQSVAGLTSIDMRPEHCWFNPLDTREIWLCDEVAGGVKICRFATNVPSSL